MGAVIAGLVLIGIFLLLIMWFQWRRSTDQTKKQTEEIPSDKNPPQELDTRQQAELDSRTRSELDSRVRLELERQDKKMLYIQELG